MSRRPSYLSPNKEDVFKLTVILLFLIGYTRFIKLLSTILFAGHGTEAAYSNNVNVSFLNFVTEAILDFFFYLNESDSDISWYLNIFKHDFHSMLWIVILKGFLNWKNYVFIISIGGMLTERKTKFLKTTLHYLKHQQKQFKSWYDR